MINRKHIFSTITIVILVSTVLSCTAGSNDLIDTVNTEGYLAGFLRGLWHGFTLLFTFIISLFNKNVSIYEVHNSGALYNLGYLIGVSIFFSGSGHAGKKARRK